MQNDLRALQAGHIALCAFPYARDDKTVYDAAEKIRPCLVIEVSNDEVWVAKGTSQNVNRFSLGEFVLPANSVTGLDKPTKIQMGHTVRLPRTSSFFGTPAIIGSLPEDTLRAASLAAREAGII